MLVSFFVVDAIVFWRRRLSNQRAFIHSMRDHHHHHHRDPILDLSLLDDDILFIESNKKRDDFDVYNRRERERERETKRRKARTTTCACAACVAELSDTAAATTAETAFPAMVTIGFTSSAVLSWPSSLSSSSEEEARTIIILDVGRRVDVGRRDPATTRAAARPPVKLVMRVVDDDDTTAMMMMMMICLLLQCACKQ